MDTDGPVAKEGAAQRSVVRVAPPVRTRKLKKVPFVELADGRLQGVVSSGSDIGRVYVSSIDANTLAVTCSTNNNRPCGGLGAGSGSVGMRCKHLLALVDEARLQFGTARVARVLGIEGVSEDFDSADVLSALNSHVGDAEASVVFSRFLRYLSYLELEPSTAPIPEMHWFPAAEATS